MRQNPEWYHKLSRHPEAIQEIKAQADDYFGRSMKKKIEQFGEYLGMLNMFMEMTSLMEEDKSPVAEQTKE
ncbi:hypothetical protein GCM10007096_02600 [Pullulanibacillus pueri]|uniref:YlbE-like protein n=2 Tax=Pullulanibacillus pueri TaxID=1437324 RepID=A0A8J2ZSX6_9BACL|nr:hypothetical protein GCM10007096_02600 [Pullulanibacillus pueri]